MNKVFSRKLKQIIPHLKLNEPLVKHTTFRMGGKAKYFAEIESVGQLEKLLAYVNRNTPHDSSVGMGAPPLPQGERELQNATGKMPVPPLPLFVLGAGSNVLVTDKGWTGIVIKLKGEFEEINICPINRATTIPNKNLDFRLKHSGMTDCNTVCEVVVGAGMNLPVFLKKLQETELGGLEFLAGIPGTVGGAVMMNAGLKKQWIGQYIQEVEILDFSGGRKILAKKDINFAYRSSSLDKKIMLFVKFVLKKTNKDVIMQKIKKYLSIRKETQPQGGSQMGSIFKNPPGDYAGRLIEAAGFKGCRIGKFRVSGKHANFIIHEGNGKAKDFLALVKKIKSRVKKRFGKELELEIKVMGEQK